MSEYLRCQGHGRAGAFQRSLRHPVCEPGVDEACPGQRRRRRTLRGAPQDPRVLSQAPGEGAGREGGLAESTPGLVYLSRVYLERAKEQQRLASLCLSLSS